MPVYLFRELSASQSIPLPQMAVMEVPGKNHSVCPTILIMCISILD
jgi:hypothetical protein